MRIAVITYASYPGLAEDDRPLLAEFASRGWEPFPVAWDDPSVDWSRFDLLLLRSCWDYHLKIREFQEWIDRVENLGKVLLNPAKLVRWNLHKSYLADLQDRGVKTPRTVVLEKGSTFDLRECMKSRGWTEAVVKPAVSASSWRTFRVTPETVGQVQPSLDELLRERDALVQEFLPEVLDAGEISMIFIGGAYSHAVRKIPAKGDFRAGESNGGRDEPIRPGDDAVRTAGAILDTLDAPWLYARVDGVERKGDFILTELELIEPSLFFGHHPPAVRRFADALTSATAKVTPSTAPSTGRRPDRTGPAPSEGPRSRR